MTLDLAKIQDPDLKDELAHELSVLLNKIESLENNVKSWEAHWKKLIEGQAKVMKELGYQNVSEAIWKEEDITRLECLYDGRSYWSKK